MAAISIFLIRVYQFFFSPDHSVFFPSRIRICRYYPSCSEYTAQSLKTNGFMRGVYYSVRRVIRCNPWVEGGYDPAP